jgi:plasmid stabilization system protein ParE
MPKSYEVIVSAEAQQNIRDAFEWIVAANPSAAGAWYDGLVEALQSLSTMPLRCPLAPETRVGLVDRQVRQLLYGRNFWKYRVLFVVEAKRVLIAHVRHGARLYLGEPRPEEEEQT